MNYLIIGSAAGLLLLLWIVVGVRHLIALRAAARRSWEVIDEVLRKRQDLVPLLTETVRKRDKSQLELENALVAARVRASSEYEVSGRKVEVELELAGLIEKMLEVGMAVMPVDTGFLGLRTEISELESDLERDVAEYNTRVRSYNHARGSLLLSWLAWIGGFRRINIFETK